MNCWRQMRGVARVKFYVTDDDGLAMRQLARVYPGAGLRAQPAPRWRENDWAYSWQKYYKPSGPLVSGCMWCPSGSGRSPCPPGRRPLYLNPGLTFGTGSHASTQLCLEGVEEHTARRLTRVLDLGCGSGILSIAALVLGAG